MHVKGEVISANDKACKKANGAPYCWDDQDCFARIKFVQADFMAEERKC